MTSTPCSYVRVTLLLEPVRQLDNTKKWVPGVLFIQQSHQGQVLCGDRNRLIIQTGMTQSQQTTLSGNTDLGMLGIYQLTLLSSATDQIFF
jgi:hypothetical protein